MRTKEAEDCSGKGPGAQSPAQESPALPVVCVCIAHMRACVCVHVHMHMRTCVHECAYACAYVRVCAHALYF